MTFSRYIKTWILSDGVELEDGVVQDAHGAGGARQAVLQVHRSQEPVRQGSSIQN